MNTQEKQVVCVIPQKEELPITSKEISSEQYFYQKNQLCTDSNTFC
jgi:hypothetical protein